MKRKQHFFKHGDLIRSNGNHYIFFKNANGLKISGEYTKENSYFVFIKAHRDTNNLHWIEYRQRTFEKRGVRKRLTSEQGFPVRMKVIYKGRTGFILIHPKAIYQEFKHVKRLDH